MFHSAIIRRSVSGALWAIIALYGASQDSIALTNRSRPVKQDDNNLRCEVEVMTPTGATTQITCSCEQLLLGAVDPNPFFPQGPMVTLQLHGMCRERGVAQLGSEQVCTDHCDCTNLTTNPWNPTNWFPYWVGFMIEGNGP